MGETLVAYFEEHKLEEYMVELDKEYDYITMCNDNSSYTTIGKATFSNYRTYVSDEIHPEKEGYEWKSVDFTIVYSDENAWEYGMLVGIYVVDYYDDVKWTDDGIVNNYGIDYSDCVCTMDNTDKFSGWKNNQNIYTGTISVQVPKGYDGLVFTLMNEQVGEWTYAAELKDTAPLFFRFE